VDTGCTQTLLTTDFTPFVREKCGGGKQSILLAGDKQTLEASPIVVVHIPVKDREGNDRIMVEKASISPHLRHPLLACARRSIVKDVPSGDMKGLHNVVLAKDVQGNAFWVPIKQEGGLPVVHVSHNTGMALAGEAAPAAKVKMKLDPSIKPDKVKQLSHDDKMLVLLALHQRLAHSTGRRLYLTLKERGWGDVYTQKECAEVNCDVCRLLNRKACKIPRVPEQARAAWKPGEKAYQDLTDMPWGVGGFKKLSVIVDGVSRRVSCMALRHKDQAIIHAVAYIEQVRQEGMKVRVWRSDNGGEFISDAYTIMLAENSIAQKTGAPYTPESQGIVERANGTIKRLFGKVLRSLGTPASLWPGLVQGVVQAINNAVHASTGESPYKKAGLLAKQELPVLALGDTIQAMDPQDNLAKEGYYGGSISPQVASCIVRSTNGGWRILRVHPSSVKLLDWGRGIEPQVPGKWTAAPPEKQLLPDNVEYDSIDGDQYEDGVGQGAGEEEPADNLDIMTILMHLITGLRSWVKAQVWSLCMRISRSLVR
jgi:transposase InsO family protein